MNTQFLRRLRLKPESIIRDLDISRGLASTYHQRTEDRRADEITTLAITATYFRRAGANALLLGRYADAKELFLQATLTYSRLELPYSVIVAALSSKGRSITEDLTFDWLGAYADHELDERIIPQLAYVVLAQTTLSETRQVPLDNIVSIRRSLEPYRLRPLGALGVSVGVLLDLSDSLDPQFRQRESDLTEVLAPFFGTYNTAILQTMRNHYHWERLALPFHPADPDIYGVLGLTNTALQIHHDDTLQRFIEQAAIGRESRNLLSTIFEGMSEDQQDSNLWLD